MNTAFPLAAAVVMISSMGCASSGEFNFRDDKRPGYAKIVTTSELERATSERITVLDVRLLEDYEAEPVLIPGARYKDPDHISSWFSEIPRDTTVVVYCVRGKWVSQKAASFLANHGYDTYTLEGGLEGWQAAGNPVVAPK